jgi:isoamylase
VHGSLPRVVIAKSIWRNFELPPLGKRRKLKVVDTALPSPADIANPGEEMVVPTTTCRVEKHSIVVVIS